jgi:hypothetical protein
MGEEAFSGGGRPNHAARTALSFGREDDGSATASPAFAVVLGRDDLCGAIHETAAEGKGDRLLPPRSLV